MRGAGLFMMLAAVGGFESPPPRRNPSGPEPFGPLGPNVLARCPDPDDVETVRAARALLRAAPAPLAIPGYVATDPAVRAPLAALPRGTRVARITDPAAIDALTKAHERRLRKNAKRLREHEAIAARQSSGNV